MIIFGVPHQPSPSLGGPKACREKRQEVEVLAPRADLGTTPITVVDVETTGIFPGGHDRIIEIALLRFRPDSGVVEDEYTTLVNPTRDIGRADIHGICAGDLLQAPEFGEVAGDISHRLCGTIVAGHNVRFDLDFLRAEYGRLGVEMPSFPTLCTLRLAYKLERCPSRSLSGCCAAAGVEHRDAHTATGDARACLGILRYYLPQVWGRQLCDLGSDCDTLPALAWFHHSTSGCAVPRDQAAYLSAHERSYLSRLVTRLPGCEGSSLREAEYLCLLDRVLEDRGLTRDETESLCAAASAWGMGQNDVNGAHRAYVWALARQAKADGVVTDLERRDLLSVCDLLGVDMSTLAQLLEPTHSAAPKPQGSDGLAPTVLAGKTVCFTGELLGKVRGERVTREVAEEYARRAGMLVKSGVTKGLEILVVADPDTQSGKAKKAREYGTRILAEAAFWAAIGANVE